MKLSEGKKLYRKLLDHMGDQWHILRKEHPEVHFAKCIVNSSCANAYDVLSSKLSKDNYDRSYILKEARHVLGMCDRLAFTQTSFYTDDRGKLTVEFETFFNKDMLFMLIRDYENDIDGLFKIVDVTMKHEFGHVLVGTQLFNDETISDEEKLKVFAERSKENKYQEKLHRDRIEYMTETDDEDLISYYSIPNEAAANEAVGISIYDIIDADFDVMGIPNKEDKK